MRERLLREDRQEDDEDSDVPSAQDAHQHEALDANPENPGDGEQKETLKADHDSHEPDDIRHREAQGPEAEEGTQEQNDVAASVRGILAMDDEELARPDSAAPQEPHMGEARDNSETDRGEIGADIERILAMDDEELAHSDSLESSHDKTREPVDRQCPGEAEPHDPHVATGDAEQTITETTSDATGDTPGISGPAMHERGSGPVDSGQPDDPPTEEHPEAEGDEAFHLLPMPTQQLHRETIQVGDRDEHEPTLNPLTQKDSHEATRETDVQDPAPGDNSLPEGSTKAEMQHSDLPPHNDTFEAPRLLSPPRDSAESATRSPVTLEGKERPDTRESRERLTINSWATLDSLLNRHPYLRDRPRFEEQYRRAQWYIALKDAQQQGDFPHNLTEADIARHANLPYNVVSNWLDGRSQPALLNTLAAHEAGRRRYESQLLKDAHPHRLDPSYVYEAFRPLRNPEQRTPENLAQAIETLYRTAPNPPRIVFAELRPYHQGGPHRVREVAATIDQHRSAIEQRLEARLGLKDNPDQAIRIAVVGGDTLYLQRRDTNPDNWLNMYAHEHFYFHSSEQKSALINEARRHMNLNGDIHLGHLIARITDYSGTVPTTRHQISDIRREDPVMEGETLHFLLDATGKTLNDIQSQLSHLGTGSPRGGGRIFNPRFPEVEPLRTRIYCAIRCDGHISDSRHLIFTEKSPQRVEYVKSLFRQFGDIECRQYERPRGFMLHMPVVLGRVLEEWGVPVGDKCLRNVGLPSTITKGSPELKRAYLEELIPQDGNFHADAGGRGVFQWTRATVLDAGSKTERSGFEPRVSPDTKDFIREFGKMQTPRYGGDTIKSYLSLRYSRLESLQHSDIPKTREAATRLAEAVWDNQNRLITDEVGLCRSLGIRMTWGPQKMNLYESGRVSVIWNARTSGQVDALRFAVLAPPADTRKRAMVTDWLGSLENKRSGVQTRRKD